MISHTWIFCNELLREYYKSEGLKFTHDTKYNDGCSSQFNCIQAFRCLARSNIKITHIFCETSTKNPNQMVWELLSHMYTVKHAGVGFLLGIQKISMIIVLSIFFFCLHWEALVSRVFLYIIWGNGWVPIHIPCKQIQIHVWYLKYSSSNH